MKVIDYKRGKQKVTTFFYVCLAVLICLILTDAAHAENQDADLAPTCTESGYRTVEEQGVIRLEEIPPLGHQFGDWIIAEDGKSKTHTCSACGYEETIRIGLVPEEKLPWLNLKGEMEGIGKKNRVVLEAEFVSEEDAFQCYGIMTLQGHSTYGFPKKNYTIRFYDDPEGKEKHKSSFRDWDREHKYILKANYEDLSQCRNLVGAEIWEEMTESRSSVPEQIRNLPHYGAVDGFPVAVYLNGSFFGLYTLNLHKDDDLYQMKNGRQEAILICNAQTTDEALFRAPAAFAEDYSSDWEVEFCGTEDDSWAKESFNQLITFVMESSDEEFAAHLDKYLDVDAAVDYLLFIYALGLEKSGAKDLVLLNYGDRWIPTAFDMDEAFGLDPANARYRQPEEFLPVLSEGRIESGTGSLLWDRLLTHYQDRIIARYRELRENTLSGENMIKHVKEFIAQIPESFYDYDTYLYPDRPVKDNQMDVQIEHYITERTQVLDRVFGVGGESK